MLLEGTHNDNVDDEERDKLEAMEHGVVAVYSR
jgi:hypothetical protein